MFLYDEYLGKQVLVIDKQHEETAGILQKIYIDNNDNIVSIKIRQITKNGITRDVLIPFPFKLKCEVFE